MKIVFLVVHLSSGGGERTVSYLSKYMADQNCDVTILSISNDVFYEIADNVKLVKLGVKTKYKNVIERYKNIFLRYYRVNKAIKKLNPDVVFCILPETAKYILTNKRKFNYKLITSERINPEITQPSRRKLKENIFRNSDGVIFQTKRAYDFYDEQIRNKGIVIHNAVGNQLVYQVPDIVERKNKISSIGRLAPQKDYPTLIDAFCNVAKTHPDYMLDIYGSGPDYEKLRDKINADGLNGKVILKGACLDAIVQAADSACYVMSSLYEGMPNALMEAMAVGLPCVSTDCPNGPAELITNGNNGLLVPVQDVKGLADAILKMMEDTEFATKCGNNAKNILNTHSIDIKAKEYMDFIVKVYNEDEK